MVETRPLHYQSSLLFASLDKNRDEDNYTCLAVANVRSFSKKITLIMDDIKLSVQIPSKFYKVFHQATISRNVC